MAITDISICNSALSKMGADRIASLTENNKRARICNEQYLKLKEEVLTASHWNFAQKRAELASTGVAPLFEWDYQFPLPSDCLKVLRMSEDAYTFSIEGKNLLTNESTCKILYISNVNESFYTAYFAETLALRMAADLAYNLIQNVDMSKLMMAAYNDFLRDSRSRDSQEGTPRDITNNDFIDSRV